MKKPEEQENSDKKEENTENKNDEEKTIKVHYKSDNDANNDKTSFCHIIFRNGVDIDITTKKIFECYENINVRNFLLFKKNTKIKTLLFIEEQYLYLLKDIIINKNNENLRRISNRFDLNKLFDYKVQKTDNNYLFSFDFLKNDNLLDRHMKHLLFEHNEGVTFEEYLIEILEKIDATYLDEIFENEEGEDEEEEEEEEEEKDEKENGTKDADVDEQKKEKDNDEEKKVEEDEDNKEKVKVFRRVNLDDGKDSDFKNSSSREIL